VVTLITAAALLLNPYGVKAVLHPFKYLYGSTSIHMNYIMEWMSPDFHSVHGKALIFFTSISLLSFIFSPVKPAGKDLFLYFSFLAGSLCSARNIPLFIIVSSPATAKHMARGAAPLLKKISDNTSAAVKKSNALGALNYLLIIATAVTIVMAFRNNFRDGYLQENELPVKAVEKIAGLTPVRLLHPYHWGGYLINKDIKVFIDGRADFYPGEFLEDFFQSTELLKNPDDFFKRNDFDYILWEKTTPLTFYINNLPDWKMMYSDDFAVIFKRKR